ncbi:MAG TPA: hypothetical protein VF519_14390 [Mycobacteriales bacterium]|jgi:hypothetical protein
MRLARPLVAAALVAAAFAAPAAQAAPSAPSAQQCLFPNCDPFWLFRACGPLVACP